MDGRGYSRPFSTVDVDEECSLSLPASALRTPRSDFSLLPSPVSSPCGPSISVVLCSMKPSPKNFPMDTAHSGTGFYTVRRIIELVQQGRIVVKKSLGQNFLVDRNVRDKLLSFPDLREDDTVIEIGAGLGALTEGLLDRAGKVCAFETDAALCDVLRERFGDRENLDLIEGDFLQTEQAWWNALPGKVKVVSNTPYSLSIPIVYHLHAVRERIACAFLTVQKEVGERMTATPGSKAYGPISVLLSLYTQARIWYFLGRDVFFPKPDVNSVVVGITPRGNSIVHPGDEENFQRFLPHIFSYRRKKLTNVIATAFDIEKAIVEKHLARERLPENTRIEELSPEDIYRVFHRVEEMKALQ